MISATVVSPSKINSKFGEKELTSRKRDLGGWVEGGSVVVGKAIGATGLSRILKRWLAGSWCWLTTKPELMWIPGSISASHPSGIVNVP